MFVKAINKIILILVLLSLFNCGIINDSYKSRIDGNYIPRNLNDAISEIEKQFSDSTKNSIKQMSENDFIAESHFGTGKRIRNNWSLWRKSRLSTYFNKKGVFHPDDMSSIILRSYHRKTTKKEINLNEQIAFYKKYWEGVELTKLPNKKDFPESDIKVNGGIHYGHYTENRRKHATIYYVENPEEDKYWIYDYFIGWKKINRELKEQMLKWQPEETEKLLTEMLQELNKIKLPR